MQLFGTKRIRLWPPSAYRELHVFPDAHPRARKAQVNLEWLDSEDEDATTTTDRQKNHDARFPFFRALSNPYLDVLLEPGDVLEIPAFWFHHVENGRLPQTTTATFQGGVQDEPTVSINLFSLSQSMMMAQRIFQTASQLQPFAVTERTSPQNDPTLEFASVALRALGWELLQGLSTLQPPPPHDTRSNKYASPHIYIRTHLLQSRYGPLLGQDYFDNNNNDNNHDSDEDSNTCAITNEQTQAVQDCVARILPDFAALQAMDYHEHDHDKDDHNNTGGGGGIVDLVALHLLELWAVQLVGAPSVADAWKAAVHLAPPSSDVTN